MASLSSSGVPLLDTMVAPFRAPFASKVSCKV